MSAEKSCSRKRMLACFPNSYGRFGPRGAVPLLRSAGIEWIELPIKTAGVPSFFQETPLLTDVSTPGDCREVERFLAENGVRVAGVNLTTGNPLDPTLLEKTLRKLDVAAHFGATPAVGGAGEAADEPQLQTLYEHLRRIGDRAAALGITYCFETHPGLCRNADGMLQTMQALRHPHLKLNFDTGNILYYNAGESVEASLQRVVSDVRHVHLKDTSGRFQDWCFPALGEGRVDFVRIREILDAADFSGPYSLEIEGIAGEPELSLEQYHQRIVDSVAHLRRCGY